MKKFKVGVIGLGNRGSWWASSILATLPYVEIAALCDLYDDRLANSAEKVKQKNGRDVPFLTKDYRELIDCDLVDTVLVFSSWDNHVDAAIRSMKAGKAVGIEVGGAYSVEQCFELVRAYEDTKTPFMFLENCCYGEIEMTVTAMARAGMFGTIVHCDGGYGHEMRNVLAGINRDRHYRGDEYRYRNCENYPSHSLGPICKLLDIGNGNRFISLVSMFSKAASMKEFLSDKDNPYKYVNYSQGDIFTTLIKCAGGETVRLTLDTTLPRYYSRDFTVRGTRGLYEERTNSIFLDGNAEHTSLTEKKWKQEWGNMEKFIDDHRHPLWKKFREEGVKAGHGGMDYLVISAFFEALDRGLPMPIDVYDAASIMAVTALSEQSVILGSAPVAFPDFTCGKWMHRKEKVDSLYQL